MELLGDVGHVEFVSVTLVMTNPMVLLGDGGLVEARFSTFEDSVSISAR